MKLRLISRISLDKISNFKDSKKTNNIYILNSSIKRRKFIKFAGTTIIGISISGLSNMLFTNKAYSNNPFFDDPFFDDFSSEFNLIDAGTREFGLSNNRWRVQEPMSGSVNVINTSNEYKSGDIVFALADVESLDHIEDQKVASYEVPPRTKHQYEFSNGTRGQSPGDKKLGLFTQKNKNAVDATVYV